MLDVPLDNLEAAHIHRLCDNEAEESLRLEFKAPVNLDERRQKLEAAKDISAMANTVGGRILYGVSEKELDDGSKVADEIEPITDGSFRDRLHDVINSAVHPRPRIRSRTIEVPNGSVLVVEIYPSYAGDLHMVQSFNKYRFYKRGPTGAIRMTEPEIREAYSRIAASRLRLEETVERSIQSELNLRSGQDGESIVIAPWYGRPDMVNPRHFGSQFGLELANAVESILPRSSFTHLIRGNLGVFSGGFRCLSDPRQSAKTAETYWAILRNGLLHISDATVFESSPGWGGRSGLSDEKPWFRATYCLGRILEAVRAAQCVLEKAGYWGPVRLLHRLQIHSRDFEIVYHDVAGRNDQLSVEPGSYTHVVPEVNLRELGDDYESVASEMMHQLFQTAGQVESPWFDEAGHLVEDVRKHFGLLPPRSAI